MIVDHRGRRGDSRQQRLPRPLLRDARRHRRPGAQHRVPRRAFTRIDGSCTSTPGEHELPLNFFNDNSRFSFFKVAVRASGAISSSRCDGADCGGWHAAPTRLYVDAPGGDRRDVHRRRRSVAVAEASAHVHSRPAGIVLMSRCRRRTARRGGFRPGPCVNGDARAIRCVRGRHAADSRLADDRGARAALGSRRDVADVAAARVLAWRVRA